MGAHPALEVPFPEPVSIGDLLDASYPPLPLGGAEDVGPSGPGPRHWDQPGPERDVGRG
jgi:hypothetical protein